MSKAKPPNAKKNQKSSSRNKAKEEYDTLIDDIFKCNMNLSPSAIAASNEEYRLLVERYGPTPFDPYERKYNQLKACTLEKARIYDEQYHNSFIGQGGLPTISYKKLLTRVIQRLGKFDESQLYQLQLFFFSWDGNEALTGVFRLTVPPNKSDPNYLETDETTHRTVESIITHLQANMPFYNSSNRTIELSNSLITHLIKLMMLKKMEGAFPILKRCPYGNSCYRTENPFHYLTEHNSPFLQRGSSKKRKTQKRRSRKN